MSNKKLRLTPWFDGTIKPLRNGIYQRHYDINSGEPKVLYCKFKNGVWWVNSKTPEEALKALMESPFQDSIPWRGLAENPEVTP